MRGSRSYLRINRDKHYTGAMNEVRKIRKHSDQFVRMVALSVVPSVVPSGGWAAPEPEVQRGILAPNVRAASLVVTNRVALSVLWPEDFDPTTVEENTDRFKLNWSRKPALALRRPFFEGDGDPAVLNVVGHGLFGSELYLAFRTHGHSPLESLGMTAAWSTLWEYGVEAWHKRPSGVDLLFTPIGGAALGELRYRLTRRARARSNRFVEVLFDPLGALERSVF